jgi:hypothetical protein
MAQQTAVEWLWNTLIDTYNLAGISPGQEHLPDGMLSYLEQAKQIEKEQMIELTQTLTSTPSDISRDTATFIVENFINR